MTSPTTSQTTSPAAATAQEKPMLHVAVDTGKCAGHGRCYTLAPRFFEPDDEGFPVVLRADVDKADDGISDLLAAVDNCPERALTVTEQP